MEAAFEKKHGVTHAQAFALVRAALEAKQPPKPLSAEEFRKRYGYNPP